jgi:hypothetical protein
MANGSKQRGILAARTRSFVAPVAVVVDDRRRFAEKTLIGLDFPPPNSQPGVNKK